MRNNPRLLLGHTMTEQAQLHPIRCGLSLNADPLSTASMTLCESDPDVEPNDWIRMYRPNGKDAGVFRVTGIRKDVTNGMQRELTLEHCFATFKDAVLFGEISPSDMGGSEEKVALNTALSYLIGKQKTKLWKLGACEFTKREGWKFNNAKLFNAITSLTASIQDYEWKFDMSSLPWTVSLVKREATASREMRLKRNIATMVVTIDKRDMYTRLYPIGNGKLTIASVNGGVDYLERNVDIWGLIEETDTNQAIKDAGLLKSRAEVLLEKHSTPLVTVKINGFDFSAATGLDIDDINTGYVCQVPLPEYKTTITERITSVSWSDIVADPYAIEVTLANKRPTLTDYLNERTEKAEAHSSAYGSGSAALAEELRTKWTEIQQDEEHISLIANEIGLEKTNTGEFKVTSNAISQIVRELQYKDFGTLVRAIEAGAKSAISPTDLENALEGYVPNSALSDYLTISAASELYATDDDVKAVIGAYVVQSGDSKKSLAQILADQISMNASLTAISGALTVGDSLTVDRSITAHGGIAAGGNISADGFTISGTTGSFTDLTATGDAFLGAVSAASLKIGNEPVTVSDLTVVTEFTQALGETAPTTNVLLLTTSVGPSVSHEVGIGEAITF